MISNINYAAKAIESVSHLPYRTSPPYMYVCKTNWCTLVMFKTGKCRLMGCKRPTMTKVIDVGGVKVSILRILSVSVNFEVGSAIRLCDLGNYCHHQSIKYLYEPELFPALRLSTFDPLCVNVFASGKCVILGLKHLCYAKHVKRIKHLINTSGSLRPLPLQNAEKANIRKDGFTSATSYKAKA